MTDDELERLVRREPPRGYRALLAGSIASGIACFLVTIALSQQLVPADAASSVEFTPLLLVLLVLFAVLLAACIALGYVAARRKPPSD